MIPGVVIRIEIERRPVVYSDCDSDSDEARLIDWLDAHPAYRRLVAAAFELAREETAA